MRRRLRPVAAGFALVTLVGAAREARAEVAASSRPLLVDATLASSPDYVVALCEGQSYFDCVPRCGGTLVAPNLVVTSRHCADTTTSDSLDCKTYRFEGKLKDPRTIWVSAASVVTNDARFRRGMKWDVAQARSCGHDLALLTLEEPFLAPEATPTRPTVAHDPLRELASTALTLYGYGETAAGRNDAGTRKSRQAEVLCVGGRDSCDLLRGGADLLASEFAMNATVCPGDSGAGVHDAAGSLLGVLARSIGQTGPCAYGVYVRMGPHALLLASTGRAAARAAGYAVPSWVDECERVGNSADFPPRGFGAPCDRDEDCSSGACGSFDGGLSLSCVRPCRDGCADGTCRETAGGPFCFYDPDGRDRGSTCASSTTNRATPSSGATAAFVALAMALIRRARLRG